MKDKYQEFISKPEISFWVPLISSLVALLLSYGALFTRISVLETKIEQLTDANLQVLQKFVSVETRYGELSLQVARLEERIK